MLRIFVGYDSREPVAYHVLAHSLLRHASAPLSIVPLVQDQLRAAGVYTRERGPTESTEFSLTRFLVPYLSNYTGTSIFMDCDMLAKDDIHKIVGTHLRMNRSAAVSVCQHDYVPKDAVKMDGCQQTTYPRKNWSSFMIFNNARCAGLTPDYVNSATGLELHRLLWAHDRVGSLPLEWNWLVGEYEPNADAKLLHYTLGGPWFRDYAHCDHSEDWYAEYARMNTPPVERFSKQAWESFA